MTLVNSLTKHLAFAFAILIIAANGAYAADGKAADDIAHFIAGMPPSADSPLAETNRRRRVEKACGLLQH